MIPLAVLLVNHHTVTVALPPAKGLYRVLRNPAADALLTLLVPCVGSWLCQIHGNPVLVRTGRLSLVIISALAR